MTDNDMNSMSPRGLFELYDIATEMEACHNETNTRYHAIDLFREKFPRYSDVGDHILMLMWNCCEIASTRVMEERYENRA